MAHLHWWRYSTRGCMAFAADFRHEEGVCLEDAFRLEDALCLKDVFRLKTQAT